MRWCTRWCIALIWITIFANGLVTYETACSAPKIIPLNFCNEITVVEGTNRTLSCEVDSDSPLRGSLIWDGDPRLPEHVAVNAPCVSSNVTCIRSNLTLINISEAVTGSLTAENECGKASVSVHIEIYIPESCQNVYSKAPKLLSPPPKTVMSVEGHSVTVKARYKGKNDSQLLVYWYIKTPEHSSFTLYLNDDVNGYKVTMEGCPPLNTSCCYFTIAITIELLTLNLSGTELKSAAVWLSNIKSNDPGFSTLMVYVRPVIATLYPNPKNGCTELDTGQSIKFTCTYNASTNRNVTVTKWWKPVNYLQNTSHYTLTTKYGSDPINLNHVQSTLTLSNVVPDNNGTYTCQCFYNDSVIRDDDRKVIRSNPASFCLKVNAPTGKKQSVWTWKIAGAVIVAVLIAALILLLCLCWRSCRKYREKLRAATPQNETSPLLVKDNSGQLRNVVAAAAADDDDNNQVVNQRERSTNPHEHATNTQLVREAYALGGNRKSSLVERPKGVNAISREHTDQQDKLISGQDNSRTTAGLTPGNQRAYRQPGGNMVTGATTSTLPSAPPSTSLETFSGSLSGDKTIENNFLYSCVSDDRDVTDGLTQSSAVSEQCPSILRMPTSVALESDREVPRASLPAECTLPSVSTEHVSTEADMDTDLKSRILNHLSPLLTKNINMENLLPHLEHHQLLDNAESFDLQQTHAPRKKAQMLVGYLKLKGDSCLQMFLCSLNSACDHLGHKGVAVKLKEQLEQCNLETSCPHMELFCSHCVPQGSGGYNIDSLKSSD